MRVDHLGDLIADAVYGVQRGHRILEDHRDLFAADVAKLIVIKSVELAAPIVDGSGDPSVWRLCQTGQRLRGNAFAATGFADDGQYFAGGKFERNAVDRLHNAVFGGEADPKVVDAQERAHVGAASPSRMRGSRRA